MTLPGRTQTTGISNNAEWARALQALNHALATREGELADLEKDLASLRQSSAAQADSLDLVSSRLNDREIELSSMRVDLDEARHVATELSDKLESALAVLSTTQSTVDLQARALAQANERLVACDVEMADLAAALSIETRKGAEHASEVETLKVRLQQQEASNVDWANRVADSESAAQALRSRTQYYAFALRAARLSIGSLTRENAVRTHEEARFREYLQRGFETTIEQLRAVLQDRERTIADRERMIAEQEDALRAVNERLAQREMFQEGCLRSISLQRDKALQQLELLNNELSAIASHWSWRWTAWIRPAMSVDLNAIASQLPQGSPLLPDSDSDSKSLHGPTSTPVSTDGTLSMDNQAMNDLSGLLTLQGPPFVEAAYRLLLKRSPDSPGLESYLSQMRRGVSKQQILLSIAESPEGQKNPLAEIPGLQTLLNSARHARPSLMQRAARRMGLAVQEPLFKKLDEIENRLCEVQIQLSTAHDQTQKLLNSPEPMPEVKQGSVPTLAPLTVEALLVLAASAD